jgi:uncharacterized membrane protein
MKRHARVVIASFAALGLVASAASLYVHYQLLANPSYASFCDISETVSCEAVLTSRYGSIFGIPVAVAGAIWSGLVLLLALVGMRPSMAGGQDAPSRVAGRVPRAAAAVSLPPLSAAPVAEYIFVLSVIGLASVAYLAYASFFILRSLCPLCLAMYVAVLGVLVVSATAASNVGAIPARLGRDLGRVFATPFAATVAIAWVIASVALIAFFPREELPSAAEVQSVTAPTETLGPEEVAQFGAWLDSQPRVQLDVPANGARVVVVKFNDYQCPACRQAYLAYRSIERKYETSHPGQVAFISLDYPLDSECNTGGMHGAACEAAAAVRMARTKNRSAAMEEWLFANQASLTRDTVKQGLAEVAQITDFDAQYARALEEVRVDARLGQKLELTGTPTFFINGVRIDSTLRPAYFDAAIAHELNKATESTPQAPAGRAQTP